MVKHIMIALDGSEVGEAVLPLADRMMRAVDARVSLVRVVPVYVGGGRDSDPDVQRRIQEAREYLEPVAGRLRDQGVNARAELRFGLPVEELLKFATVEDVDLLAMTTHGRSGVRRLMLGSVTEQVIRRTTKPVLVMKSFETAPRWTPKGFRHVLVALDGSARSERVLAPAVALARLSGARVSVMTVVPETVPAAALPGLVPGAWPANPKSYLRGVCLRLEKEGVEADAVVAHGSPVDRLAAIVAESDVDLVAMATHGRSGVARWILGSVPELLIRTVQTPALIVRVPEDDHGHPA